MDQLLKVAALEHADPVVTHVPAKVSPALIITMSFRFFLI